MCFLTCGLNKMFMAMILIFMGFFLVFWGKCNCDQLWTFDTTLTVTEKRKENIGDPKGWMFDRLTVRNKCSTSLLSHSITIACTSWSIHSLHKSTSVSFRGNCVRIRALGAVKDCNREQIAFTDHMAQWVKFKKRNFKKKRWLHTDMNLIIKG